MVASLKESVGHRWDGHLSKRMAWHKFQRFHMPVPVRYLEARFTFVKRAVLFGSAASRGRFQSGDLPAAGRRVAPLHGELTLSGT